MADRIRAMRPGIKVLFMSGYPQKASAGQGIFDHGNDFLQKPFRMEDMARKVREVLDRSID